MKKLLLTLCVFMLVASSVGSALAGSAATTMKLVATVQEAVVRVTAKDIDFGIYDTATGANGAGSIDVTAPATLGYKILIDKGMNQGMGPLGMPLRALANTTAAPTFLSYLIFQPGGAPEWGDDGLTYPAPSFAWGGTNSYPVPATIPPQGPAAPGIYTDVVNITVIF